MIYYAYLDANDVVQQIIQLPSVITDSAYIQIDSYDESLIGKKYNRETGQFETVNFLYYAVLQDGWVISVVTMTEVVDHPDYVLLTSNDQSLVGCWYDRENEVFLTEAEYYLMQMKTVDGASSGLDADTLDGIEASGFATAEHTHDGYATAEHTHSEYALADHTHGETGSALTPAEILAQLKTVDGTNSGLDADLLDGYNSDHFAVANHTHADYATTAQVSGKADADHTHTGFANADHTHTGFAAAEHTHADYATAAQLANKADVEHTHSNYATTAQLDTKADATHTHADYATITDLDDKADFAHSHSEYAELGHTHTGYATTSQLAAKADASHTHSGYASSSHSHSNYLSTSGGTVSGNLNVTGVFRINGQQGLYNSGSMVTLSTNNLQTMIAGSAIYSKVAISVSSDERLKENIETVNVDAMRDFVKAIDVKTFNYIGNDKPCVGVIAQDLQKTDMAEYFVSEDGDGYLSVKATDLVFPLIVTLKDCMARIEELEKKE